MRSGNITSHTNLPHLMSSIASTCQTQLGWMITKKLLSLDFITEKIDFQHDCDLLSMVHVRDIQVDRMQLMYAWTVLWYMLS